VSFFFAPFLSTSLSLSSLRSDNTGVITRQPHCRLTELAQMIHLSIQGLKRRREFWLKPTV
jgi:hypothetical protein